MSAGGSPSPAPSPVPRPAEPPETRKGLARKGDVRRAYAALGAEGVARVGHSKSVDDLLAVADIARLSGHPEQAVAPLERVIAEHPGDARSPFAAFMLGRVQLDSLGAPAAAARAFRRAIDMGIPGGLAEDAYLRLVESSARAGDRDGARAAPKEYAARFPAASRASDMHKWVVEP